MTEIESLWEGELVNSRRPTALKSATSCFMVHGAPMFTCVLFSSLVLSAVLAATASHVAIAADAVAEVDCAQKVCGFNVTARALRVAPCQDRPVLVAYSQDGGATLIQCSAPFDSADNMSYLFDRRSADTPVFELTGTRFIKPDFLAEAAASGVPDSFGAVPLCMHPEPATAAPGELLLVAKTTGHSAGDSSCYRLLRVGAQQGRMAISADQGEAPAAAAAARAKWAALAARLLPHVKGDIQDAARSAAPANRPARVTQAKAPLFDTPAADATTRAYLVKGDMVEILDQSRAAGDMFKVRFITKSGRKLERWIHSGDLDLATPEGAAR